MESKVNYTAVGLFVVLLAALLGGLGWWLATGGKQVATRPYLIYATDNVSGLKTDSNVLYRGVTVGKVASIEIDPKNPSLIRIKVEIDRSVPVRSDTVAQLSPLGVTGLSAVNLIGGASPTPLPTPPGEPDPVIPYKPSVFTQIEGGINDAAITLARISQRVDALLSPANVQAFSTTVHNLQALTATLAANQNNINAMFANARQTSANLAQMSAEGDALMRQSQALVKQLGGVSEQLGKVMPQISAAASSVTRAGNTTTAFTNTGIQAMAQLQNRTLPEVDALMRNLQQLSSQLGALTESLKSNPSQLLYGPALPPPGPGEQP
ncbi:MlaD family protein [Thiomonas bhubaneswarensis]|uniref:ABC-type transporter Mla maintaining outer membrane lipid asymmetry, periplasmic component MlaD n=1 Tax=Thiomonas bhubaneswarensis TaxID=339866 RepID=A0A0K6HX76_9BURK|nr:MlaD family protein [Thiomonas bhubaneswarensis]CUA95617.1 ABC-type transporter Mla maintaining outer membrane lipid asymmetry, periplasmic component MlaD [Thiomonas bhubaneswarensis]